MLIACKRNESASSLPIGQPTDGQCDSVNMEYSELLKLSLFQGHTFCQINNAWQKDVVIKQYLLVEKTDSSWNDTSMKAARKALGDFTLIRTPLERMTLTSSCHAWLLAELDALDHVSVMTDTAYVKATRVLNWLRSKDANGNPVVADGGASMSPNVEVILANGADALWISPIENMSQSHLEKLPITLIYCADYLETSSLGRAEWMKFFGRLVGKSDEADALFASIARKYEDVKAASDEEQRSQNRPHKSLFAELPYGGTWYVPGGHSTAAMLYEDAGFDYAWNDDTHAGSLTHSKEMVLAKAQNCDIWLIKYNSETGEDLSLQDLLRQDELYSRFKAAQQREVWGCNTAISDYFDVSPFRPDSVLESLSRMDGKFFKRLR